MARRDESTKWAHSLGREVAGVRFHFKELPQRGGEEGAQTANTGSKRVREVGHVESPPSHSDKSNDDTSRPAMLCKIAHTA
jgi:hypothetical protein